MTTSRSWSAPTALSQWCQGFLYGFGTGRCRAARANCSGEVEEVLRDLTHISQASVETGADAEEEEQAYAEIVEYVRAGVQLIHDELIELRAARRRRAGPILPA